MEGGEALPVNIPAGTFPLYDPERTETELQIVYGSPLHFQSFYQDATIRPVFYQTPEAGASISLASVFGHQEPQIRLVQAVGHLFGLYFYTDELTKTIYVEPRFTFLNETHDIDWSEKIDTGQPVLLEEWGDEYFRVETYRYKAGDAALARHDAAAGKIYGSWSIAVENRFAATGERLHANPLFIASRDEKNSLGTAPDASMIVAGNRDADEAEGNFPPKIVRYLGMKPLPAGQKWGWPSYGDEYPQVMFHSAGEDWYTLRFDDTDGQLGLKNYLQPHFDAVNRGKKLTLHLRLTPSDMEAILHPNSADRNFRGNFVFWIRGEKIRGRLLEVSGYNPSEEGIARCVFSVEL